MRQELRDKLKALQDKLDLDEEFGITTEPKSVVLPAEEKPVQYKIPRGDQYILPSMPTFGGKAKPSSPLITQPTGKMIQKPEPELVMPTQEEFQKVYESMPRIGGSYIDKKLAQAGTTGQRIFWGTANVFENTIDVLNIPQRVLMAHQRYFADRQSYGDNPSGITYKQAMSDALFNKRQTKYSDVAPLEAMAATLMGGRRMDEVRKQWDAEKAKGGFLGNLVTVNDALRIVDDIAISIVTDGVVGRGAKEALILPYTIANKFAIRALEKKMMKSIAEVARMDEVIDQPMQEAAERFAAKANDYRRIVDDLKVKRADYKPTVDALNTENKILKEKLPLKETELSQIPLAPKQEIPVQEALDNATARTSESRLKLAGIKNQETKFAEAGNTEEVLRLQPDKAKAESEYIADLKRETLIRKKVAAKDKYLTAYAAYEKEKAAYDKAVAAQAKAAKKKPKAKAKAKEEAVTPAPAPPPAPAVKSIEEMADAIENADLKLEKRTDVIADALKKGEITSDEMVIATYRTMENIRDRISKVKGYDKLTKAQKNKILSNINKEEMQKSLDKVIAARGEPATAIAKAAPTPPAPAPKIEAEAPAPKAKPLPKEPTPPKPAPLTVAVRDVDIARRKAALSKEIAADNRRLVSNQAEINRLTKDYIDSVNSTFPDIDKTFNEMLSDLDVHDMAMTAVRDSFKLKPTATSEATAMANDVVEEAYKNMKRRLKTSRSVEKVIANLGLPVPSTKKGLTNMRILNEKIDLMDDAVKYMQDIRWRIGRELQRGVYLNDIKSILRPSKYAIKKEVANLTEEAAAAVRTAHRTLEWNKAGLDDWAKALTSGVATSIDDLELEGVETLHKIIAASQDIPASLNDLKRVMLAGTPQHLVFERLGTRFLWEEANDANFFIVRAKFQRQQEIAMAKLKYAELFDKKWSKQSEGVLAAHYADKGVGVEAPVELQIKTGIQAGSAQDNFVKDVITADKILTDKNAEEAIARGLLTRDPEVAARTGIALYQESYYPHYTRFRENIHKMYDKMRAEKYKVELYDLFDRKAFKSNIPATVNAPEFHKRLGEVKFSDDWETVTEQAYVSELKKLFLEPVLQRGKAYIAALPEIPTKSIIGDYYASFVKGLRGMEMTGDVKLNQWFYRRSKFLEEQKSVQKLYKAGAKFFRKEQLTYVARQRAWEHFSAAVRHAHFRGTMLGNTRVAFKNLFQSMHTINTIGGQATIAGIQSMFDPYARRLLNYYPTAWGRVPMDGFDTANFASRIDMMGMWANQNIERFVNVAGAGNGAAYRIFTKSDTHMNRLIDFALKNGYTKADVNGQRFWEILWKGYDSGEFDDVIKLCDANIMATQWNYSRFDLPLYLQSETGRTLGMFTSWSANFFTNHLPMIWKQLITGENVLEPAIGRLKWSDPQRYAALYYASAVGILVALGYETGHDMTWLLPTQQMPSGRISGQTYPFPIAPPVASAMDISKFVYDLGNVAVASLRGDNSTLDESIGRLINYDVYTWTPGGVQARRVGQVISGKESPASLLLSPLTQKAGRTGVARPRKGRKGR